MKKKKPNISDTINSIDGSMTSYNEWLNNQSNYKDDDKPKVNSKKKGNRYEVKICKEIKKLSIKYADAKVCRVDNKSYDDLGIDVYSRNFPFLVQCKHVENLSNLQKVLDHIQIPEPELFNNQYKIPCVFWKVNSKKGLSKEDSELVYLNITDYISLQLIAINHINLKSNNILFKTTFILSNILPNKHIKLIKITKSDLDINGISSFTVLNHKIKDKSSLAYLSKKDFYRLIKAFDDNGLDLLTLLSNFNNTKN